MVAYTKTLAVGPGTEGGVFLGPIQNSMQYERVKGFFADIEKSGMKVAMGGQVTASEGYFIHPTIIDNPDENSRLVVEEQFGELIFCSDTKAIIDRNLGPIVPLLKWSDEGDVVARANNTKMGLGASVWSSDLDEAARLAKQLETGSVWVNAHLESTPHAPFGGHKESGIGTEYGISGLKAFCNSQTLFFKKKI